VILLILLLAASSMPLGDRAGPRPFSEAVEEYVRIHRRVRASLPAVSVSDDPKAILKTSDRLASALRQARPGARRGDLFNPVVAASFRARIAYALRDRPEVLGLLTEEEDEEDERPPAGWVPAVNGTLDWFATGATPPSILHALPSLPEELQYRFVKLDLVLLDVDANLIVDILPGAIAPE
jgi:hypothetical protein